jgi:hypothetical protein
MRETETNMITTTAMRILVVNSDTGECPYEEAIERSCSAGAGEEHSTCAVKNMLESHAIPRSAATGCSVSPVLILSRASKRPLQYWRELDKHKPSLRVEVIFAALIDHPKVTLVSRVSIGYDAIYLV